MSTIPSEVISWEQIDSELFFGSRTPNLSGKALQQWQELIANARVLVPAESTRVEKISALTRGLDINRGRYADLTQSYADILNCQLPLTSAKLQTPNPDLLAISSNAQTFGQLAYAASVFAPLVGSKAGPALGMMAQGAMGLSSSCAALSSGFALGPAGICAASVVMIGQAFLSLSSSNDSSDELSEAFGAIFSGLQQISNQIFQLSQFVEKKFDELFKKLDEHHREVKDYLEYIRDFLGFIEGGMSESYLQQVAILDRLVRMDLHRTLAISLESERRYKILLDAIGHNLSDNPLYDAKNIFEDIAKLKAEFAAINADYIEASKFISANRSEFARFFDFSKFADKSGFILLALMRANPRYHTLPKLTMPYEMASRTHETVAKLVAKSRVLFRDAEITPQSLEDVITKIEQELTNHHIFHTGIVNTASQQALLDQFVTSASSFMTVISQAAEEQETALFWGADPRYRTFKQLPAIASLQQNLGKFKTQSFSYTAPGSHPMFCMCQKDTGGGWQHVDQGYLRVDYVHKRQADVKQATDKHIAEVEALLSDKTSLTHATNSTTKLRSARSSISLFDQEARRSAILPASEQGQRDYSIQLRDEYVMSLRKPLTRFILPRQSNNPILYISRSDLFTIPEYLWRLEQAGAGQIVMHYTTDILNDERPEGIGNAYEINIKIHIGWQAHPSNEITEIATPVEYNIKETRTFTTEEAIWIAWAGGLHVPTGGTTHSHQVSSARNEQNFYAPQLVAICGNMPCFKSKVILSQRQDLQQSLALYKKQIRRGFAQDILKRSSSPGPIKSAIDELVLTATLLQLYLIHHNSDIKLEERSAAIFTGFTSYRQLYAFLSTYNGGDMFLDNILAINVNVVKQFYDFICGRVPPHISPVSIMAWGQFLSGEELESKLLVLARKKAETRYEEEYESGLVMGTKIMRTFIASYLSSHGCETAAAEMEESYEITADASMALRSGISAGMNTELMQSLIKLSPAQFEKARTLILRIIPRLQELAKPANLAGRIEFKPEKFATAEEEVGVRRPVRRLSAAEAAAVIVTGTPAATSTTLSV